MSCMSCALVKVSASDRWYVGRSGVTVRNLMKSPFLGGQAWNRVNRSLILVISGDKIYVSHSSNQLMVLSNCKDFDDDVPFWVGGLCWRKCHHREGAGSLRKLLIEALGGSQIAKQCIRVHVSVVGLYSCMCVFSRKEHLFMTPFIFSVFWWVFKLKWPYTQRLAFPPCLGGNVWLHGQALKPKKKKKPKTGPLDLCHENLLTSTPKSHFPPWS